MGTYITYTRVHTSITLWQKMNKTFMLQEFLTKLSFVNALNPVVNITQTEHYTLNTSNKNSVTKILSGNKHWGKNYVINTLRGCLLKVFFLIKQ